MLLTLGKKRVWAYGKAFISSKYMRLFGYEPFHLSATWRVTEFFELHSEYMLFLPQCSETFFLIVILLPLLD